MDDLLSEFLTETSESLDVVDVELVKFEQEPNNAKILDNIFRLVHTIKGTCGFLGLPRLESLAHAGESLMGKFRDGAPVTQDAVSLILKSIDRIKEILGELGETGAEPQGSDDDLISELDRMSEQGARAIAGEAPAEAQSEAAPVEAEPAAETAEAEEAGDTAEGSLVYQVLERPLKPGEVSLDDLEKAFLEAEGPDLDAAPAVEAKAPAEAKKVEAKPEAKAKAPGKGDGPVQQASLRVNVETLEHLITMVSELVLTRNQLLEIVRRHEDSEFKVPLQRLSNVTAELQEGVMQTRMQPIGNAWQKLPRIVRDLAQELGKDIELDMVGAETELDRQVLELIKDPLTHMVRNSADHGLESTEDRVAKGKSPKGLIRLSAYHEGGHIIISIADDGRGLNAAKIRQKVIERGLATEAELEKMSESQVQRFIFNAGFSTAQEVTSVSGRGVGMDVVRTNIELIGGNVDLKSVQGEGTTFTIKIPLTLAIVSALIVECAGQRLAIPQLAVVELVRAQSNSEHRIERIKDTPVLRLRNKLLPLMSMREILGMDAGPAVETMMEGEDEESGFIVVMQVGGNIFGVVVDGVFHTEEIVVKPMSTMLRNISTFSGNTILGDGSVIMILDPNGVANMFSADVVDALAKDSSSIEERSNARELTSLLLFTAGSDEPKAVPLSLVTRLEEIPCENIERSNGRLLVQYRGSLMPLVFVNDQVQLRETGTQPMLVFSDMGRSMGLVIDRIVDIVEDELKIEVQSVSPGILGSAVIKGHATEMIDVGHFLPMAFDDWLSRREMAEDTLHKSIMLVDDSPFFRNMLSPVLKSAGYSVKTFNNGREALEALEAGEEYDLIVSDIEMPEMNGFELAERIRSNKAYSSVPVIALSSHNAPATIERGRQAGFQDFVAKFDRQGLLASINEIREHNTGAAA